MRALADAHLAFSAGVLNIGDSDHTLALYLAGEVITEQPFSPVTAATRQRLHELLQAVSLLIVCPMPIGPGNLALLSEALELCQQGVPVLLLLPPGTTNPPLNDELMPEVIAQLLNTPTRDYTHGDGVHLFRQLVEAGATLIGSVGEAAEYARRVVAVERYAL
jgi:cobalamin transport system ATP-binding protein